MKEKRKKIMNIITIVLLCILAIIVTVLVICIKKYNLAFQVDFFNFILPYPKLDISDVNLNCSNITFIDTVSCIADYIEEIYVYNSTSAFTQFTLESILERGGDCFVWSVLWKELLESYGFNADIIALYKWHGINFDESGHAFIVAYDDKINYYCKIDMIDINCVRLGGD